MTENLKIKECKGEKVGARCGVSGMSGITGQEVIHCCRLFWFLSSAASKHG